MLFGTQIGSASSRSFAFGSTLRFILGVMSEESHLVSTNFEQMLERTYTLCLSLGCNHCERDASLTEILVEEFTGISGEKNNIGGLTRPQRVSVSHPEKSMSLAVAASPCLESLYRVVSSQLFAKIVYLH